jgi:hypothetical protein
MFELSGHPVSAVQNEARLRNSQGCLPIFPLESGVKSQAFGAAWPETGLS